MAAVLHMIQSSQAVREELWRDPRALIARTATDFPEDVIVSVARAADGRAYFQAALPRDPDGAKRLRQRMRNCPITKVAEADLVTDPGAELSVFGIKVPEDVEILSDAEFITLRVWLKHE